MAYHSVKSLLETVSATNDVDASDDWQSQENLITFEPEFEETLAKILAMMQSKLDRDGAPASKHDLPHHLLQALSFSGMAEEVLSKLNIKLSGSLKLKSDYNVRVAATERLGMTSEHWSSEGLYRHLCVLQKLVPRAARVPSGSIPFSSAHLQWCHKAVLEVIDQKNIIRGTVTDGHNWIFLVLKMDYNGDGAIYTQSLQRTRLMTVVPPGNEEISRMCDVIAGIIGYWVIARTSGKLHIDLGCLGNFDKCRSGESELK